MSMRSRILIALVLAGIAIPAFAISPKQKAEDATGRLGECVVRASPAGALGALRTKPESPDELTALKALTPQIAGCVKGGQTRTFNRTNLRAAIALSYYRLAYAAGTAGKQGA